jgi:hypothetical protein
MRGSVLDTAMRPMRGAVVEVLDGPNAHATANPAEGGLVQVNGSFDRTTRFRASAEGHESLVQTCADPCSAFNGTMWINFYLRPLSPPAIELGGNYTLTVTASASCESLPAESRTRTYPVSLTARTRPGTADVMGYIVDFQSDVVVDWTRQGYFGVAGNDARAYWLDGEGELPGLIEALGDNRYVTFHGTVEATLNPGSRNTFTMALRGAIEYLEATSPLTRFGRGGNVLSRMTCTAIDHRVVLTPR